uniref:Doublecortin domain-containing protein n=1 Tax=Hucho hucho TaxID=62062 RepID=A0A4W5JZU0_9TELE
MRIRSARKPPIFMRQPHTIRVNAYKNGTRETSAKVTASNITTLQEVTSKLKLNSAARKIFLSVGTEVSLPKDLAIDLEVFVSMGEAFLDPQREI